MIHNDRVEAVEQMLPQETPPVRDEITTELVRYYQSKKYLPRAEALLGGLADSDHYPFSAVADLVTAMGPEQAADRMTIFNQALNNFEQRASNTSLAGDDVGTFIERTWRDVPSGLALEAINKVLETAKEQSSQSQFSMSSAKGSVVLKSRYDLRLFELLPILEELDKDQAERLLRERTEVAEQLKTYPRGMRSLNSESTSFSYGVTDNGSTIDGAAAKQQIEAQMQVCVEDMIQKADADPWGALAGALTLPVQGGFEQWSPRSRALLGIAEKATKKKPSVFRSALDEFSAVQDQLTPQQMTGVGKLPELYLGLGNVEGAQNAVNILVKAGAKLYEHDTDAENPNKAFKGACPSTDLWRIAIQQAAKISPNLPEEVIAGLQDSEIAAYEKVALASALVGTSGMNAPVVLADCRKNGSSYRVSF